MILFFLHAWFRMGRLRHFNRHPFRRCDYYTSNSHLITLIPNVKTPAREFRHQHWSQHSGFSPSPLVLISELWADRTRGPQPDQQMVKDLPFQAGLFVYLAKRDDGVEVDGDLPKVLGPGSLEHCVDPTDIQIVESKLHTFELRGLVEVN